MSEITIKKAWFKPYNYTVLHNNKTYYIKAFSLTPKNQLTIHSKHIWNIQHGRVDGARYITTSKRLIHLNDFHKQSNLIYYLKNKPYKILKYLNESDIIDITDHTEINGIPICYSIHQINEYLNGNV